MVCFKDFEIIEMMKLVKGHWLQAVLVFLLAIGFFYRINGLDKNYSFWTDEASTARFARGILETGVPQIKSTGFREDSYFVTHYLTAASFFVFGEDEFAARIPEVVFGTLLILAVFYFGKVIFNNQYLGLGAALLTTFSYAQITWSRQARGYVILEVFFLLSLFFLYQIGQANKKRDYFAFFLLTLLSIWTHSLGLILIPIGIVYIVTKRGLAGFIKSKQIFWGTIIFIVVTILFTNLLPAIKVIFINHLPQ
ncbi:hypothetical protein FJZ40_04530, partial [Candidatus Shapirobacteria bacterium]|nr:hypothetical protein [Candidatus Shapirobacteria bacterium]